MGLPVLRIVRLRSDFIGGNRGSASGVLLPDRALCWSDAVCRPDRQTIGNWLDHGNTRFRARLLLFGFLRYAYGRDDRSHLRRCAGLHGRGKVHLLQSSPGTGKGNGSREPLTLWLEPE